MEPRVNVITLAVDDLERALVFYRDGLGLETKGLVASDLVDHETGAAGAIVIYQLESGLIQALYPRSELGKDAAVPAGPPQIGQFSLGQLVGSRAEVDRILQQAAAAGAVVTPPHDHPWGIYSGYFRALDGHLWEIIWNPGQTSDSIAGSGLAAPARILAAMFVLSDGPRARRGSQACTCCSSAKPEDDGRHRDK